MLVSWFQRFRAAQQPVRCWSGASWQDGRRLSALTAVPHQGALFPELQLDLAALSQAALLVQAWRLPRVSQQP
jgi:hypothetical protein